MRRGREGGREGREGGRVRRGREGGRKGGEGGRGGREGVREREREREREAGTTWLPHRCHVDSPYCPRQRDFFLEKKSLDSYVDT